MIDLYQIDSIYAIDKNPCTYVLDILFSMLLLLLLFIFVSSYIIMWLCYASTVLRPIIVVSS